MDAAYLSRNGHSNILSNKVGGVMGHFSVFTLMLLGGTYFEEIKSNGDKYYSYRNDSGCNSHVVVSNRNDASYINLLSECNLSFEEEIERWASISNYFGLKTYFRSSLIDLGYIDIVDGLRPMCIDNSRLVGFSQCHSGKVTYFTKWMMPLKKRVLDEWLPNKDKYGEYQKPFQGESLDFLLQEHDYEALSKWLAGMSIEGCEHIRLLYSNPVGKLVSNDDYPPLTKEEVIGLSGKSIVWGGVYSIMCEATYRAVP
ncbi:hypothetical protein [Shewanella zhuhaiensis]|uniref:hypothetical protein n=1 Tax=Shewanella zhuhaiensis TaxID=2919576 RepID=UPI001F0C7541|nr:hypothetical protein [Shewanella zhuhaiensis]